MAEPKVQEFIGTGRRKTAVTRVRLASGSGKITVNNRPFENYFPMETLRMLAVQPLAVTETAAKFDVRGKGTGQPGIGLGLATVKRMVQAHGGTVGVCSEIGRGSTFFFDLPEARPAAPAKPELKLAVR